MSEDVLSFIKIINRNGNRLNRLIKNLFITIDIESKEILLKKEKVDIARTIEECVNDLILSLKEKNLLLKVNLEGAFLIEADKVRIEQIILNLLSNAIKYTPPKGIIKLVYKNQTIT